MKEKKKKSTKITTIYLLVEEFCILQIKSPPAQTHTHSQSRWLKHTHTIHTHTHIYIARMRGREIAYIHNFDSGTTIAGVIVE